MAPIRTLDRARRSYPLREDNVVWTGALPGGLVRLAALEAGRRLVQHGLLEQPDDAVQLDVDTLRAALTGKPAPDLRARVRQARAERLWT
ncbi:MAG: hypothetical protein ACREQM_03770, partial [Candidatus Dormibacteraceae bacterium]